MKVSFYGKKKRKSAESGNAENDAGVSEKQRCQHQERRGCKSRVKLLVGKASDKKANNEIEKAYDLLNSSPTRSIATVKSLEEQIKDKVTELENAVASNDTAAIITIAGELVAMTEERNKKLKIAN